MDISFVDLDMALGRVRDARSRKYLQDAIKAYRAGALRPAVTATWVATAFDLISKIKELAEEGDPEAGRISNDWSVNREANNAARLVELERSLIEDASGVLQLLTPVDARQIKRLQEDRHLCAHPAFSTDAELFEPTPELVRLHIVNSVELVLSQRPIQGRTILDEFSKDVVSPGFPVTLDRISDYFERKYIERTRPNILMNLAVVIAKGILRNTPEDWQGV